LQPRFAERRPNGSWVFFLYVFGLVWLTLGGLSTPNDWYLAFAQGVLVLVSLTLFGFQVLGSSGALQLRHARQLGKKLTNRKNWPEDLHACRNLPEVSALRQALSIDAAPALALLRDTRPPVRVAALTALELRKQWRPGQIEIVLHVAQHAREAPVKAAAITALARVDDAFLISQLAEFLGDSAEEVRRAAGEALLWDPASRWSRIRIAIRAALAEQSHVDDELILPRDQVLPPEAVKDLTGWAGDSGVLSVRAARMLCVHYSHALAQQSHPRLVEDLLEQVTNPQQPAGLRIELAQLLQKRDLLDQPLYQRLLDPLNPAPVRLIAAEALLRQPDQAAAVGVLREIARLPNREIALAIAAVVQRQLGVDLGMPVGQPPPLHSRMAAEVTRRVMLWGADGDAANRRPVSEALAP
jgi:HEAT repeat protein